MENVNMSNTTQIVTVNFEKYDHGYIATSKEIEGLFVVNKSFDKITLDVVIAIKLLMKAIYGSDWKVEEIKKSEVCPVGETRFYAKMAA